MPNACTTHGKTHQHDVSGIDLVTSANGFDRLEDVDFSGVFEPDAMSAKGVQDNCTGRGNSSQACLACMNKMQVGCLVSAPVEPDI